jgi:ABC-type antimicrobial peptide transport system permease subunit
MASVDPNLPIVSIRTLREQVAGQFTQQRLIARLTSFFGALSLSLGLLLGIPLALAAGRFLGSQLYGINQYDPTMIIAAAILVLGFSALTAALIPAFRASSISPLEALRENPGT